MYWGIDRTVSIYIIHTSSNDTPKKELLVSRFIQAGRFGWETFNVTSAVLQWLGDPTQTQVLEVRIEGTPGGGGREGGGGVGGRVVGGGRGGGGGRRGGDGLGEGGEGGGGRGTGPEIGTGVIGTIIGGRIGNPGGTGGRDRSWSLRRLGIDTRPNREPLLVVYSQEDQQEDDPVQVEKEIKNHELDMIRDDVIDDNNGLGAKRQVRRYLQLRGRYPGGGVGGGGGGGGRDGERGGGGGRSHRRRQRAQKAPPTHRERRGAPHPGANTNTNTYTNSNTNTNIDLSNNTSIYTETMETSDLNPNPLHPHYNSNPDVPSVSNKRTLSRLRGMNGTFDLPAMEAEEDGDEGGRGRRWKRRLAGRDTAGSPRRTKRGKSRRKSRKHKPCRKTSMYVNFADIKWHLWVIAPKGYEVSRNLSLKNYYIPNSLEKAPGDYFFNVSIPLFQPRRLYK